MRIITLVLLRFLLMVKYSYQSDIPYYANLQTSQPILHICGNVSEYIYIEIMQGLRLRAPAIIADKQ